MLLRYSDWTGAEIAEQLHHVVVVWWRRWDTSDDPVEPIGIGAIEQSFEPVELRAVEAGKVSFGKRDENDTARRELSSPVAPSWGRGSKPVVLEVPPPIRSICFP